MIPVCKDSTDARKLVDPERFELSTSCLPPIRPFSIVLPFAAGKVKQAVGAGAKMPEKEPGIARLPPSQCTLVSGVVTLLWSGAVSSAA